MIRITRTDALIGINTTPTKMNISQPKADFEMHQKHAKIQIDTEQIQIQINQTQCFNEAGLKSNTALTDDMVTRARQAALEGIGRIVSEGNSMGAIENGSDVIVEIAASNSIQAVDWNIDFIPKSRPEIDFVGGNVDISVDEGYVAINSKPNKPIIEVEVGGIEIYLRQKPELKIEFVGNEIDVNA